MAGADPATDFEAWASLAARLRERPSSERARLLHELGLTPTWDGIHEAWSRALNDDIVNRRMERPNRYLEICAAEQRARASAPGDFREALMPAASPPVPVPAQSQTLPIGAFGAALPAPAADFRASLLPRTAISAPVAGQEQTLTNLDAGGILASANAATGLVEGWPVERWAEHCAALARAASWKEAEARWVELGVENPADRAWVESKWAARLAAAPQLYERFRVVVSRG